MVKNSYFFLVTFFNCNFLFYLCTGIQINLNLRTKTEPVIIGADATACTSTVQCTVHICCTSTVLYCAVQICCKAKFCTHVNKSQTFTFTFASFSANPQARFSCREIQIIFGTVFLQHSELLMCTFVNIAERTLGTVQNTWPCC